MSYLEHCDDLKYHDLKQNVKRFIIKTLSRFVGCTFDDICTDGVQVVSLDVFDTLLYRSVKRPTDVFDLISTNNSFKYQRMDAERRARADSLSGEVTLTEIYRYLPDYSPQLEIDTELKVLFANEAAQTFFDKIGQSGIRVIITSDMYLSRDVIAEMLERNGYNLDNVTIYVSSDYGETKRTGALFRRILSDLNIDASQMVHIGDDYISDYYRPKQLGIKSYLVFESNSIVPH